MVEGLLSSCELVASSWPCTALSWVWSEATRMIRASLPCLYCERNKHNRLVIGHKKSHSAVVTGWEKFYTMTLAAGESSRVSSMYLFIDIW